MNKTIALIFGLALLPGAASSQDWTFDASLYGWFPGLDATVDTRFGEIHSSSSGSDALQDLDMAFMGTFEARHDRWGFILDVIYTDFSDDKATPFDLAFSDADLEMKMTAVSGYAAYRVYETPQVAVDAALGFRTFGVELDATLNSAGRARSRDYDANETWTVPLIAGRVIVPFNDKWFATAYADVGATSADASTWQAFASIGYRFSERWSAQLAYRYMDIQKEFDGLDADFELGGPLVGVTFRF